jgi:hypothetical protein
MNDTPINQLWLVAGDILVSAGPLIPYPLSGEDAEALTLWMVIVSGADDTLLLSRHGLSRFFVTRTTFVKVIGSPKRQVQSEPQTSPANASG